MFSSKLPSKRKTLLIVMFQHAFPPALMRRMARNRRTPQHLEEIALKLSATADTLRGIAASMREGGLPDALVHSSMQEHTHIPAIEDWADKLIVDVRSQVRAYVAGVQSKAELHQLKNDNQKLAAAKKPWPKKAAKKKPPA
jgi:hypothetical protein